MFGFIFYNIFFVHGQFLSQFFLLTKYVLQFFCHNCFATIFLYYLLFLITHFFTTQFCVLFLLQFCFFLQTFVCNYFFHKFGIKSPFCQKKLFFSQICVTKCFGRNFLLVQLFCVKNLRRKEKNYENILNIFFYFKHRVNCFQINNSSIVFPCR